MRFMIAEPSAVARRGHSLDNFFVDAPEPNHSTTEPDIPGFRRDRCASYLAGTEGSPPRAQLLTAIRALAARSSNVGSHAPHLLTSDGSPVVRDRRARALDIGCGPGREVVSLRSAGFEVDAIDPYPEMLHRTREALLAAGFDAGDGLLERATLEEFAGSLTPVRYDLVHAGFVLPFVRPSHFQMCWDAIVSSLKPCGVFAGQFFGPNDEFVRAASPSDMTSHTAAEITAIFQDWEVIEREEVDRDGCIGRGASKHWHVHHVVALKRS